MRNRSRAVPLVAGLLACSTTVAEVGNHYSGVNVGQLSQVQSETLLYEAQAERARAKRSIEKQGDSYTPPTTTNTSASGVAPVSMQTPDTLPVVKSVLGSHGSLRAVLLYSGGLEVEATLGGGELPGGYTVSVLTLNRVELTRNGKRYPLGFSTQEPAGAADTASFSRSRGQAITRSLPGSMR